MPLFQRRLAPPAAPRSPRSFLTAIEDMVRSGSLDPADAEERFPDLLRRARRGS